MTYQLYKNWSPIIARILMFCGVFLMGLSVVRIFVEKNYFAASAMFLQGLFFVIMWYVNDKKYFVRFEEKRLVFRTIRTKVERKIPYSEISEIEIGLFEVRFQTINDEPFAFNLEAVPDDKLKEIKVSFGELNERINRNAVEH